MAKSSESDTKEEKTLSERVLEGFQQKEECPQCEGKYLYSGDSSSYDSIMYLTCLRCGHSFYENEQQQEYRKGKKKDKTNPSIDSGMTLLFAMLAVIAIIYANEARETTPTEPQSAPLIEQSR